MNTIKILLIGSHGRTGRLIARRLHDEGIGFRALLRKSAHKTSSRRWARRSSAAIWPTIFLIPSTILRTSSTRQALPKLKACNRSARSIATR